MELQIMIGSEIKPNLVALQQISQYSACETGNNSQYMVDCYPYAMRGVLFGLLFSMIFWGGIIGVLILAF